MVLSCRSATGRLGKGYLLIPKPKSSKHATVTGIRPRSMVVPIKSDIIVVFYEHVLSRVFIIIKLFTETSHVDVEAKFIKHKHS